MIRSITSQYPTGFVAAVVTAAALVAPLEVQADEPDVQTSQWVEDSSIFFEPTHEIDGFTAWTGIEECRSLIEDGTVEATFETNVRIEDDDYFGGMFHYDAPRGEGADLSCVDEDGDQHEACTEISEDDLSFEGDPASIIEADVSFSELTGLEDEADCQAGELDRNHYIQLRLRGDRADGTFSEWERSELRVIVDLIRPDAPELTDVLVTANTIRVEFERSESEDVDGHAVVFSDQSFEAGQRPEDVMDRAPLVVPGEEPDSGRVDVDLEEGDTIFVGMVSRDRAGNYSTTSDSMEATVVETRGFWDFYVEAGGDEEGGYGCSAAGTPAGTVGWAVVLALLALAARLIGGRGRESQFVVRVDSTEDEPR